MRAEWRRRRTPIKYKCRSECRKFSLRVTSRVFAGRAQLGAYRFDGYLAKLRLGLTILRWLYPWELALDRNIAISYSKRN